MRVQVLAKVAVRLLLLSLSLRLLQHAGVHWADLPASFLAGAAGINLAVFGCLNFSGRRDPLPAAAPPACPSPQAYSQPPGRHEHMIGVRTVEGVRLSDGLFVVRDEECPCRTGQHVRISGDVW